MRVSLHVKWLACVAVCLAVCVAVCVAVCAVVCVVVCVAVCVAVCDRNCCNVLQCVTVMVGFHLSRRHWKPNGWRLLQSVLQCVF